MTEIGLILTVSGMGGVFVVLSLLAFVMWITGKILGGEKKTTLKILTSAKLSYLL